MPHHPPRPFLPSAAHGPAPAIPTRTPRWYDLDAQQIARLLIFGCAATVLTGSFTVIVGVLP
jgi:hypothetical protein